MEIVNANTQQNVLISSMLPLKQVMHYTGLSSTTIDEMLNKKSSRYDPIFPVQVKLSKGNVALFDSEVAECLEDKIAARIH